MQPGMRIEKQSERPRVFAGPPLISKLKVVYIRMFLLSPPFPEF